MSLPPLRRWTFYPPSPPPLVRNMALTPVHCRTCHRPLPASSLGPLCTFSVFLLALAPFPYSLSHPVPPCSPTCTFSLFLLAFPHIFPPRTLPGHANTAGRCFQPLTPTSGLPRTPLYARVVLLALRTAQAGRTLLAHVAASTDTSQEGRTLPAHMASGE